VAVKISVVVHGRGVPLMRSADAAMAAGAAELFLVGGVDDPLRRSTAEQFGAHELDDDASGAIAAGALTAAVERARCDAVLFVPAGYELAGDAVAIVADAFHANPAVAIVAAALSVETDDGVYAARWMPPASDAVTVLANPRSTAPVWAVRRSVWPGPFDPDCGQFAVADLWLRALTAGHEISVIREPVARRPASLPPVWPAPVDSAEYSVALSRFLRKHESLVACHLEALIIGRETAYARLREEHVRLLGRRDAALAELDDLRARAAHHRAFLAHHGLERLDWGDLRRPDPVARDWGYGRGGPVDRPLIARFIAAHSSDVRGRVLEVQERDLTAAFGGTRVTQSDVIDVDASNAKSTVIADLRRATAIADATYDCVILTQTAHVIDDPGAVLRECRRVLKPGGVLLATFPCASRVCLEYGPRGDFWRMTPAGAETIARRVFGSDVDVNTFGNTLTQVAFLHGLGETELTEPEMQLADPYNPMLVGIRARRSRGAADRRRRHRGRVLLYHRVEDGPAGPLDLNVAPDLFAEQIDRLARIYELVSLRDMLSAAGGDLPAGAIAVTFDDGYAHHLSTVAPMLHERRIPATFFVNSAGLDGGFEHWWDALERLMMHADGMHDAWRVHERSAAATSADERAFLIQQVLHLRKGGVGEPSRRVLTRGDVRELAAIPGMTIGAHGVDHLMLPKLGEDARRHEMNACRAALEEACSMRVTLFAYPYGAVDAASAATARGLFEFSADCAASAVGASFDVARVPRLDVKAWDPDTLLARVQAMEEGADPPARISFLP
jgi:peptidoglycan/xylan/chitin deacetylase (PgdA/CDA1 family)